MPRRRHHVPLRRHEPLRARRGGGVIVAWCRGHRGSNRHDHAVAARDGLAIQQLQLDVAATADAAAAAAAAS